MRYDVVVAGAGPAGALAATLLARGGARVLLLDRAAFPRPKLCGDTVNPGAIGVLVRHRLGQVLADGLPIDGMIVTGPGSVRVVGRYPHGVHGMSLSRSVFDARLVECAARAGAAVEEATLVRGATLDASGRTVTGVSVVRRGGRPCRIEAAAVIAADGHFSRVARPLGLSRPRRGMRRWAFGAYFEGVEGLSATGEMHVHPTYYLGVAPLPGGLANACVVTGGARGVGTAESLSAYLAAHPHLRQRFERARMQDRPRVLGPLAVDATAAGMPGLLLAGDAAGFVDPITGDGLRFALRGGELAALEALRALAGGWRDAHGRLLRARRREFASKWRFNRALRALTGTPGAIALAAVGARVAPGMLERAIQYAGDAR